MVSPPTRERHVYITGLKLVKGAPPEFQLFHPRRPLALKAMKLFFKWDAGENHTPFTLHLRYSEGVSNEHM
jgi:hypothetical protein